MKRDREIERAKKERNHAQNIILYSKHQRVVINWSLKQKHGIKCCLSLFIVALIPIEFEMMVKSVENK